MERITIKDYLNVGDSIQVFTSNGKTISGKFVEEDPLFLTIQTEIKENSQDVVMVFKPYVESYSFKKRNKSKKSSKKKEKQWTH
ncbi:hypothetical protein N9325_01150 [Alphaproteobacteria bacterium]|nr:hypothetical protein [Alphaproteobacteria bacterium]